MGLVNMALFWIALFLAIYCYSLEVHIKDLKEYIEDTDELLEEYMHNYDNREWEDE